MLMATVACSVKAQYFIIREKYCCSSVIAIDVVTWSVALSKLKAVNVKHAFNYAQHKAVVQWL